jgi:hypothetical protein
MFDRLAGDVAGVSECHESARLCHVIRGTEPAHRGGIDIAALAPRGQPRTGSSNPSGRCRSRCRWPRLPRTIS